MLSFVVRMDVDDLQCMFQSCLPKFMGVDGLQCMFQYVCQNSWVLCPFECFGCPFRVANFLNAFGCISIKFSQFFFTCLAFSMIAHILALPFSTVYDLLDLSLVCRIKQRFVWFKFETGRKMLVRSVEPDSRFIVIRTNFHNFSSPV